MKPGNAQVTTRTGDRGYTHLLGPERVTKYDTRIEALGLLDEANCALGLARALTDDAHIKELLVLAQDGLYHAMAEIASSPQTASKLRVPRINAADVTALERIEDELKEQVTITNHFVVPGESSAGASLDLARAVVRRAERHLARMTHVEELANDEILRYVNRLSDVLFIMARYVEGDRVCLAS